MSNKKIPMRKCIGCGEMKSKKEMMRVLKIQTNSGQEQPGDSVNEFVLDTTGKKNGRGAYLCFSKECLQKAIKSKGLERSFKQAIPTEVYEAMKKEMDSFGTE